MGEIMKFFSPAIRNQINLFSLPPTNTTVDFSLYAEYPPIVPVPDSHAKLEFKIEGNANQYLDLDDSFLYLRVKVVNSDGSDLKDGAEIGTTNLFMHSLFSQCDVSIKNKLVSTSNNMYPYKAYLEYLLSFGEDYLDSQGKCPLFYLDDNNFDIDDRNKRYKNRKISISKSKPVELIDKIRFDLATQDRYILNDTDVLISLTRSRDAFSLCGKKWKDSSNVEHNPDASVKILEASFFVRKQILYPSIVLAHQRFLENGMKAKYPYKRTDVKYFVIPSGNQSVVEQGLFMSTIPTRVVIGFVANSAFAGEFTESPFKFQHYNISYLSLSINNLTTPIRPYGLDSKIINIFYHITICSQHLGLLDETLELKLHQIRLLLDIPSLHLMSIKLIILVIV